MYARTLESVLAEAGASPAAVKLTVVMQELVRVVQRDLRGIVRTLRPSPAAELGLAAAVRVLADGAPRHAGLAVTVHRGPGIEAADPEAADDIYYAVSEAVHNVVKHAAAAAVGVEVTPNFRFCAATGQHSAWRAGVQNGGDARLVHATRVR